MSIVTRNFTIPAGGEIKIARQADFVRCLDATATITVQFDNGDTADLATGLSYSPEGGFRELTVLNGTANPVTVKLNLGKGQMADNRASVNTSQIMPTRESAPDTTASGLLTLAAGVTGTIPANPLRREIIIHNIGAGGTNLYGATNDGNGFSLASGETLTLQSTASLGFNGAATSLQYLETRWTA